MTQHPVFTKKTQLDYYLDKRYLLQNNKFSLKLKIYDTDNQRNFYLKTKYEFDESEYLELITSRKKQLIILKAEMDENLFRAKQLADSINPFNFDEFKEKYYNKKEVVLTLKSLFENKITELHNLGKIGTSNSYRDSLRSIEKYLDYLKKSIDKLQFVQITPSWLIKYESYLLHVRMCSVNTVGMYMRNLRAILNDALKLNIITHDIYPFGKNKFTIKSQKKTKSILTIEEINLLEKIEPKNTNQRIAKDFWLFSYYSAGINLTDLAYLRKENLNKNEIKFFRRKTSTSKTNDIQIVIPLHEKSKAILERLVHSKEHFIFNIITKNQTPLEQKNQIKLFNDLINDNFRKLIKGVIDKNDITFYNARHCWASHMVEKGAPITLIKDKLGHTDIKTTSTYIASLPVKLEMDFLNKVFYDK